MTTPTIMIKSMITTVTTMMAMVDVSEVGAVGGKEVGAVEEKEVDAVEGKVVDAVLNHVQTITNISLSKSRGIDRHTLDVKNSRHVGEVFKTHLVVQPPSLKTLPWHSPLYNCMSLQCSFDPKIGQW